MRGVPVPAVNLTTVQFFEERVMLMIILLAVAIILVICLVRVVTVQEATAVAFKYRGRFVYCAMEHMGYHFEPDGTIEQGDGSNSTGGCWLIWRFGGWVFYLRPFVKPARYADYNDPDGFGEGVHVRLSEVASNPHTSEAETTEQSGAESGSVALNVKFTSKMRVVNPYKFLFRSPRNVVKEAVEDRQDGVLRAWINSGDRKHAQAAKGNGVQLWTELGSLGLLPTFDEAKNDWGLEIVPNSVVVKEVGFDPTYQAALKAQSESFLRAKATIEETAGRILRSVAKMSGVNVDDAEEFKQFMQKLKDDPTLRGKPAAEGGYKEAFDYAQDQTKRDRAADGGELTDVRISGADGGPLPKDLAYLALGGSGGGGGVVFGGGKKNRGGRDSGGGGGKSPKQAAKEFFDKEGTWPRWWDPEKDAPRT